MFLFLPSYVSQYSQVVISLKVRQGGKTSPVCVCVYIYVYILYISILYAHKHTHTLEISEESIKDQ